MGAIRVARRIAVLAVGVICVGAALAIVWHVTTPGALATLTTMQLLVPVALVVLPVLAMAAWAFDRRCTRKARGY